MKARVVGRLGVWLVERMAPRSHREALAGDLQEEMRRDPSLGWLCWQVLAVAWASSAQSVRRAVWPAAFAVCWSLLYPAWRTAVWSRSLTADVFARWAMLDWPSSAILQMGAGLLPAVSFIWLGLFVYLALWPDARVAFSTWRLLGSLSLCLSVLLGVSLLLLTCAPYTSLDGFAPGSVLFLLAPYHAMQSVPLAASVLAGILAARPERRALRLT